MPYSKVSELPKAVQDLPSHAKDIFMAAFNSAFKQYDDEERAFATAWAAVKTKYEKNKDGEWVPKSLVERVHSQLDGYITKASISSDGKMRWAATASDIYPDVYNERMSLDLYRSFIENYQAGNPTKIYVSLSHYPSLNGKAEAGEITQLYIDGDKLKAKGIFYDNELGRAIFEAIRKDRLNGVKPDERVRVSIGFYALKMRVGDETWEFGSGKALPSVQSGEVKVYLSGILEHLAVTRSPANLRADIRAILDTQVERSDMPITKRQDAISIVGADKAHLVDEIEQELAAQPVEKSGDGQPLIERYELYQDLRLANILDKMRDMAEMSSEDAEYLLSVITPSGEVTKDEAAKRLGYLLSNLTSRSKVETNEAVENTEKPEEAKAEVEKSDMEAEDEVEVYRPFNGATELSSVMAQLETEKLEDKFYRAFSILGATASNILTLDADLSAKMDMMKKLLEESKGLFTPEMLVKLSVADRSEETSVPEPVVESTSQGEAVKEEPKEWDSLLDQINVAIGEVVTLSRPERLEKMQTLINTFATGLQEIDIHIEEKAQVQKSGTDNAAPIQNGVTQEVLANALGQLSAQFDQRLETRMAEISSQMAQVISALQGMTVARTAVPQQQQFVQPVVQQQYTQPVPVAKSVQVIDPSQYQQQPVNNGRGSSIRDIVNKTTYIPGVR